MGTQKMHLREQLAKFLPSEGLEQVVGLISQHKVRFKIVKPRASKFGDYRCPDKNGYHQITVNGNLNPFAFYITTLHEFAHLENFIQNKRTVLPHGIEWKSIFSDLLEKGGSFRWFPNELQAPMKRYISNPKASSCTDQSLFLALSKFDKRKSSATLLAEITHGSIFKLQGRIFQKGETLRKRVRCKEVNTGKEYLVQSIAEVQLMKPEHEK